MDTKEDMKEAFLNAKRRAEAKLLEKKKEFENRMEKLGLYVLNQMNTKDLYIESHDYFAVKLDQDHQIIREKEIRQMTEKFREWNVEIQDCNAVNEYVVELRVKVWEP